MQIASPGHPHLAYCTNIHPGESLAEVRAAVAEHVVGVKRLLGAAGPFGVGLRLSGRAAEELTSPGALESFRSLLQEHGLYVFTINGFPHGTFHGARVKEGVYRPDWLEPARLEYADRLAWILAELLPPGITGSISTVPGAFRERASTAAEAAVIADSLVHHVATLVRVERQTGQRVTLALEPEPCCFLETTDDAVRFFREDLFAGPACGRLAALIGTSPAHALDAIREHVGVCVDACHLAVEFEDAREAVQRLRAAGVGIAKIQVTAALRAQLSGEPIADAPLLERLTAFADGVYLHQVVERRSGGELVRHLDLPDALEGARALGRRAPSEWRIHFHVPVFAERMEPFASTQPFLGELLDVVREEAVSPHLEVETYTWDVLPEEHRALPVDEAISRELRWTLTRLGVDVPGAIQGAE